MSRGCLLTIIVAVVVASLAAAYVLLTGPANIPDPQPGPAPSASGTE